MNGTKKAIIYIVVAVIIVVVLAVVWAAWYGRNPGATSSLSLSSSVTPAGVAASSTASPTETALPANVVVPDKGASNVSADVAVPAVQSAGDPANKVSYRSFNISIKNDAYVPDTVIVDEGDTVNLQLAAVDASYGFTQPDYGFNVPIAEGKTQTIQFQALQPGNFIFYCASCGGPSKGPVGHIMVVAK